MGPSRGIEKKGNALSLVAPKTTVLPALFEGMRIIDCDSHFTEPADLWLARAPAALKGRVPVQRTIDGITHWYLEGERWCDTGGNTVRRGGEKLLGTFRHQPFEDLDPSSWSVKERLSMLDKLGIYAQILYPNAVGFSSNYIADIKDSSLRASILRMYNDFNVDIQQESRGRLFPQGLLPFWDMDFAVAEMKRLLDQGIRGFTLSDRPEALGLPSLLDPYFDRLWDLFNESGAVANFHIAAGATKDEVEALRASVTGAKTADHSLDPKGEEPVWRGVPRQRWAATNSVQLFTSNVRTITNLCFSNLFDRFPKLKVMSVESGLGWIPFVLEAMEYQFSELVTEKAELAYAKRRPVEYFHEHIYTSFWFEKIGVEKLLEDVGVHQVLVETDFPHPTCLYPRPVEHFANVMRNLDRSTIKRVLQDNAAGLFRIPLP
jgi:predicted TIM-barrel fold metal-dependent hydrolase